MASALITPEELAAILPSVKMLDASYGVPDAQGGFARAHIGDAQFFDIDAIADPKAPYPHMLPSAEDFSKAVGALGIGNDDEVVVYDQTGISFAASRAWWMFRVMGHDRVRVLNGGLPAWMMTGQEVKTGIPTAPAAKTFKAAFRPGLYRSFDQIEDNEGDLVVDARNAPRFNAMIHNADGDTVPAQIPGSVNQPFQDLLDERGRLMSADIMATKLFPLIAPGKRMVASCGSGVTACVVALGFYEAGFPEVAIYDGSWTEYADRNSLK